MLCVLQIKKKKRKKKQITSFGQPTSLICYGLHVDTGGLLPLAQQVPREQRHCDFCASGSAEDEHHFVFDCPAVGSIATLVCSGL